MAETLAQRFSRGSLQDIGLKRGDLVETAEGAYFLILSVDCEKLGIFKCDSAGKVTSGNRWHESLSEPVKVSDWGCLRTAVRITSLVGNCGRPVEVKPTGEPIHLKGAVFQCTVDGSRHIVMQVRSSIYELFELPLVGNREWDNEEKFPDEPHMMTANNYVEVCRKLLLDPHITVYLGEAGKDFVVDQV